MCPYGDRCGWWFRNAGSGSSKNACFVSLSGSTSSYLVDLEGWHVPQ
jgi:hypothetical protein